MATRPPRRVANRTADSGQVARAWQGTSAEPAPARQADEPSAHDAKAAQRELIDQLEASLRTTAPEGEDAELDFVIAHMRKAIAEVSLQPGFEGPDRNAWVETLEGLGQDGLLVQEERDGLIRQLGEATSPLQSADVQIALELAQRIARDGEQAAMAWLASQRSGQTQQARDIAPGTADVAPGRQSIINSRSRRLRGPPGTV